MTKKFLVSSTGGRKEVKPEEYALIPVLPLREVARIYGYGKKRYSARNWERGYPFSASYSALQRHINQFWGGESIDPESKIHHLASAVFHCLALMEFERTHPEFDNRPVKPDIITLKYGREFTVHEDTSSKASTRRNRKVRASKPPTRYARIAGR